MPIPLIFIGIAAVTGATGIGKTVKASFDQYKSKKLNANSEERMEYASGRLNEMRSQCGEALADLGQEKVFVLNNSVKHFLDSISRLKNVDFTNSIGLEELQRLHIDKKDFEELAHLTSLAGSLVGGTIAGAAGGALVAFGAYSAAGALATASTGTAIASLSGAAATNATLAFFGGGSLAAGGLGVAGGSAILGGLVAGPALLVMGAIVEAKAGKNLEKAKTNAAEIAELCEQYENGALQCIAIRRRTNIYYSLLARLDASLTPAVFELDEVIEKHGVDYAQYAMEDKRIIASAASLAVTVKSLLDTPILTPDGFLTEESEKVYRTSLPVNSIDGTY